MAVFTPLSDEQVAEFLDRYSVGRLQALKGVPQGTENSTFFVTTEQGEWVLTLFEQGEFEDLPFFVDLLDYLAARQLPVPGPVHDCDGVALQRLAGRPALLFPRMPGSHPSAPRSAMPWAGCTRPRSISPASAPIRAISIGSSVAIAKSCRFCRRTIRL